ncbi:DUF1002 domain-containing protein [Clostridium tepidum]|jgi:uncharacterized protein YpuA (DUF1002 family)|uniref:DUF1002 domain-containing protein n=1 Tax=Clostridium tepidum TaxID=1962263 RepID=UPI0018AC3AD4|nr:DUF1002 domain-containing protein [Clostridium tepidum]MCR1933148.1 DUF1002 domain-containing protein [Clostridium tepidum]
MKCKKVISKLLILVFTFSLMISASSVNKVHADAFKVVTLGADLSNEQKEQMLKYFGVTTKEANVIEVNKEEEDKYLAGIATRNQIGTKSISCAYVEPTDKGGLNISTNNIYWVTESMIRNALITAGIENANVKVGSPFNVSGTAALTGILKGFETSKGGKKIDEKKKKVANEEMVVTGNLGEKIGQDEAANLINEVKKEVIKEKPKTEKEIKNIVKDTTDKYEYKLNDEDMQKITALMDKINGLDLDFKQIKNQLDQVSNKLKDVVTSEEAKGFFRKLWEGIKNFFDSILNSDKEEKTTSYNITEIQHMNFNNLRI